MKAASITEYREKGLNRSLMTKTKISIETISIETMEKLEDIFEPLGEMMTSRGIRSKGIEPGEVYKVMFNNPSKPRNRELKSLFPELKNFYEIGEELASIYLDPQRRGEWIGKGTGIL